MKKATPLILILLVIGIYYWQSLPPNEADSTGEVSWSENYEEVLKNSKESGKPILINFTGSDWCPFCVRLESEVFAKKPFEAWAEKNVHLLKCDFPNENFQKEAVKVQNAKLAEKYQVQGFPTILVIDSSGEVLAKSGYLRGGSASWVEDIKSRLN